MLMMAILAMINLCNTKEILLLLFWCFDCFSNLFQYVFHWEIFIQMWGHLRNYHSDVHSVEKLSLRYARCWEIITQTWTILRNYPQMCISLRNYHSIVYAVEKLSFKFWLLRYCHLVTHFIKKVAFRYILFGEIIIQIRTPLKIFHFINKHTFYHW